MKARAIDSFRGKYRFLSNFYPAEVTMDGHTYLTVEHAYQAAKATNETDRRRIQLTASPGQAKRMARRIQIRSGWDESKVMVMKVLLELKFLNHITLQEQLLETDNQLLIEGNTWGDTFWGVCNGVGENHLGELLMQVRKDIQRGTCPSSLAQLD